MRFREDRLRQLLKSRIPPWSLGQLHVQAKRFRPTLAWRTLSEVVNGKRQPTIEVVGALAQALDVDPSYLLDLADEKNGEDYAVIEGRAELAPEVENLAQRIDELPDGLREQIVGVMEQAMALIEQHLEGLNLSERRRQWLYYLDRLPDEDLEVLLTRADELLAGQPGPGDGRINGPRVSEG